MIYFDTDTAFCPQCHHIGATAKINSKELSLFRVGNGMASNMRVGNNLPPTLELSFSNENKRGKNKKCQISLKCKSEFVDDLMDCFKQSRDTVDSSAIFRFETQDTNDAGYSTFILNIEGIWRDGRCGRCHFFMKQLINKANLQGNVIIFNDSCQRFGWYNTY
jgi:hypothetical protein